MPRPRTGRGDKGLRDTLIFMERTSEKSCKITGKVILQLSLSSVIFLSYYGKWAHAPADRHRPVLQPYSSSAAGEFSGKKRAGSIRSFAASLFDEFRYVGIGARLVDLAHDHCGGIYLLIRGRRTPLHLLHGAEAALHGHRIDHPAGGQARRPQKLRFSGLQILGVLELSDLQHRYLLGNMSELIEGGTVRLFNRGVLRLNICGNGLAALTDRRNDRQQQAQNAGAGWPRNSWPSRSAGYSGKSRSFTEKSRRSCLSRTLSIAS